MLLIGGDRREHLPDRRFSLPQAEGQFITRDWLEGCSFQRAEYRLSRDLLPPGAGFPVAHQKILVIDAGKVEMQRSFADCPRPHQTGVAERSIGDGDGHSAHNIVEHVVVRHLADRVCTEVVAETNRHHHFGRVQLCGCRRYKTGCGNGMEHPFEIVHPCHSRRSHNKKDSQHKQDFLPMRDAPPENQCQEQRQYSGGYRPCRSNPPYDHGDGKRSQGLIMKRANNESRYKKQAKTNHGEHREYHDCESIARVPIRVGFHDWNYIGLYDYGAGRDSTLLCL